MTILAIDTATKVCSAALVRDDTVVAEISRVASQQHSELLLPFVDQAMKQADLTVSELDRLAVSIGPGSFTGLRIGLSVAKGIAAGAEIPIVPVPTMDTIAYNAFRSNSVGTKVSVILPARRREYYYCRYRRSEEQPESISDIRVVTSDELFAILSELSADGVAGEGIEKFYEDIKTDASHSEPVAVRIREALDKKLDMITPATTGLICKYYEAVDASFLEPLYIKQFESGSARYKQ